MAGSKYQHSFKCVIAGEGAVGKTSLKKAFIDGISLQSGDAPERTVGVEFDPKIVMIDDVAVKLQFWDIGGQRHFRLSAQAYFSSADLAVLVFDITNRNSFTELTFWKESVIQKAPHAKIILVGTKSDLAGERQVSAEEGGEWVALNLGDQDAYIEVTATNPQDLQQRLIGAITPKLQLLIAAQSQESDEDGGLSLGTSKRSSTSKTSSGFFSGLFPSRTPALTAASYELAEGSDNVDNPFSDDFRTIFRHLFNAKAPFASRTPVALAVLGEATLNEDTLRVHGGENTTSRTAQTLTILGQLRTIQAEVEGDSAASMRQFLGNFKINYLNNYNQTGYGVFRRSAGIVAWANQENDAGIPLMQVDELRTRVIEVLCHAALNPKSRTAVVVGALLQPESPSASNRSDSTMQ